MIRTAEFVSRCHPDKVCDQIADFLLDRYIAEDPMSRCAIEVMGGHKQINVTGEVTSRAEFDSDQLSRFVQTVLKDVGYPETEVLFNLATQSPEIARGVDNGGAGDQGIMYGFATRETGDMLPLPYFLAREILKPYQDHDAKSQITLERNNATEVVLSVSGVDDETIRRTSAQYVQDISAIKAPARLLVNPAGAWQMSGFEADTGLTGRKLGIDTYGGLTGHGGGAFSGKDATKVDRSAAYMARWVAKWLLTQTEFPQVTVSLAYAIGVADPVMIGVTTDGQENNDKLITLVKEKFDFRPAAMIERFDLRRPIYYKTAQTGHFTDKTFPWEIV